MAFHQEPEPQRGVTTEVARDIARAVASNPSGMTYHGTNTYFLAAPEGVFVLDPGPAEDQAHLDLILRVAGDDLAGIVVSHHHSDHFGLVPQLKALTGAPVYASEKFADDTFRPDVALADGDRVGGYEVLHTPGHASDHLCLARDDGVVLTADHVMTWNTSIVPLPDGDMSDYFAQLQRLVERDDKLCLPGHGPPLETPAPFVSRLLFHRRMREASIVNAVRSGTGTTADLAARLYRNVSPEVLWAAELNVEAHLEKLERDGTVRRRDAVWEAIT